MTTVKFNKLNEEGFAKRLNQEKLVSKNDIADFGKKDMF